MTYAQRIDLKSIPVIEVARELLGEENKERSTAQEKHLPDHGGLFVNVNKNRWFSHGNAAGGDALNLVRFVKDCDDGAGIRWLRLGGFIPKQGNGNGAPAHHLKPNGNAGRYSGGPRSPAVSQPNRTLVATHDYTDEAGDLLFQVLRYHPKEPFGFSQRRPDGRGGWIGKLDDTRRVLYRLPELIEAVANEHPIFIAEGEKAVGALIKIGVTATCSPGGALKWRDEYSQFLKGANVIILPDNDKPGRNHANQVVKSLTGVAASIKVLPLPGLPEGGDAYDWIEAGGTANKLWELVEEVERGKNEPRLHPLCIHELFELNIPERQMMLDPIIPEKGLIMLYATRGVGKTHLAVGVSLAVAAGTNYLKWTAARARRWLKPVI